jgi:DNA-binding transcriptional regulator YiaG
LRGARRAAAGAENHCGDDIAMTAHQFRTIIAKIGILQVQAAHILGVAPCTARHWALDEVSVSPTAAKLLRLIRDGEITIKKVRETPA